MASLLVQAVIVYVISVVLWKFLRMYLIKSPLDNLPGPPSSSFLTGNIQQLFNLDAWKYYHDTLEQHGSVMKIRGLLGERILFTFDPKALHHVLVKDQYIYEEAPAFISSTRIFFGKGLLSTLGEQHRKQRKMLNPVFSIAHMREMTPIFYEVSERLRKAILSKVENGPKEIDILNWMTRTALELIGQSGMGYSFDSLSGDEDTNLFSRSLKRFGGLLSGPLGFFLGQYIFPMAMTYDYPRIQRWIVEHIPLKWVQDLKDIADVLHHTALDIHAAKKKAMEAGESLEKKKDIISILMRANASATEEDRLSDEEVLGQVATLTFAAMDTTSSALSRILHLLVTHPHAQERLREEILEAKKDGELSYDRLVSLPYLDAVCRETLRVHPPLTTAIRTARKDMILPLSKPVKCVDGNEVTEILVPDGSTVFLSVLGANCNPEMWGPDSYEWKPERWLSPLPDAVPEAHMPGIYSHLMTFLGGSRACIGFKFSQLEMKVVLSVLLSNFRFESSSKKINWKMTGISAPVVEGDDVTHPSMPMVISRLDKR